MQFYNSCPLPAGIKNGLKAKNATGDPPFVFVFVTVFETKNMRQKPKPRPVTGNCFLLAAAMRREPPFTAKKTGGKF